MTSVAMWHPVEVGGFGEGWAGRDIQLKSERNRTAAARDAIVDGNCELIAG